MSDVKSDIQIAREAKMQPINEVLAKINVPDESAAFSPMGRHIAKINLEYLDTLKDKPEGKLILVTAITPTPAGEGKTTTSVGLNDGLNKIGKKSIVCLREPSLGSTSTFATTHLCHLHMLLQMHETHEQPGCVKFSVDVRWETCKAGRLSAGRRIALRLSTVVNAPLRRPHAKDVLGTRTRKPAQSGLRAI